MKTITIDGQEYKLVPISKKEEKKNIALFVLTMPKAGSWNGKFSGEGNYYARCRVAFQRNKPRYENLREGKFYYSWDDGWVACVEVKFITKSEMKTVNKKSSGFLGYEWMIDDLCNFGKILKQ